MQGDACKDKIVLGKTPGSVIQFWIFENIRNITKWILNSLEMEIFENIKKNLMPRSVSLRGVRLRAVLANFGLEDISILTPRSVSLQGVRLRAG